MRRSESIKALGMALAKFNGEVTRIAKDAHNPQFKSEYVTLDALIEATRPILQANGLSVLQFPLTGEGGQIGVKTMLLHDSGEFIESAPLFMTPTRFTKGGGYEIARDPQAAGSVISYLRRYSYQAILNLNTGEDDDATRATLSLKEKMQQHPKQGVEVAAKSKYKPLAEKNYMSAVEAGAVVIPFGTKHRGETLKQVYVKDRSYFDWLTEKSTDPLIRKACDLIVEAVSKHSEQKKDKVHS